MVTARKLSHVRPKGRITNARKIAGENFATERYAENPKNKSRIHEYVSVIRLGEKYYDRKRAHKNTLEKDIDKLLKKEDIAKRKAYALFEKVIYTEYDDDVDYEALIHAIKEWRKIALARREADKIYNFRRKSNY